MYDQKRFKGHLLDQNRVVEIGIEVRIASIALVVAVIGVVIVMVVVVEVGQS